jgi:zinc transporter ZupT
MSAPHVSPLLGIATSISSVLVSLLPWLETGLRVSVLLVGLAAGVLSLRSQWRSRK